MNPPRVFDYVFALIIVGSGFCIVFVSGTFPGAEVDYKIDETGPGVLTDVAIKASSAPSAQVNEPLPAAAPNVPPDLRDASGRPGSSPPAPPEAAESTESLATVDDEKAATEVLHEESKEEHNAGASEKPPEESAVLQAPTEKAPTENFADQLPDSKAALFLQLCAEGHRWKARGLTAVPPYRPKMSTEVVNRMAQQGMLALAVVQKGSTHRLFVFPGDFRQSRSPSLASHEDVHGFADRLVILQSKAGQRLEQRVSREFGQPAEQLQAVLLIDNRIDSVVLAAQGRAAERCDLSLKEVESTSGVFQMEAGIPFDFVIEKLLMSNGQVIDLRAAQAGPQVSQPANGPSSSY